jgi:hypothetical protein
LPHRRCDRLNYVEHGYREYINIITILIKIYIKNQRLDESIRFEDFSRTGAIRDPYVSRVDANFDGLSAYGRARQNLARAIKDLLFTSEIYPAGLFPRRDTG